MWVMSLSVKKSYNNSGHFLFFDHTTGTAALIAHIQKHIKDMTIEYIFDEILVTKKFPLQIVSLSF